MLEFFKPFRRKVGAVTLLLACGLTCVWIRSYETADLRRLHDGEHFTHFESNRGMFRVMSFKMKPLGVKLPSQIRHHQAKMLSRVSNEGTDPVTWSWFLIGIQLTRSDVFLFKIRYSTFVIPLVAFSAWGLLTRHGTIGLGTS